ncbi:GNAT family N-acetyltransferase [Sphingomonas sp.]|uniref:GNAT family N-acetyltransferase n=1 Tax=Sphingomonas sp. TaxID=28214 RepID=UPI000DB88E50|nr:GNAT family N-acetyltransferase [Sphingomonas sp.]PZU06176.1 MAG: GNAT family N-acetyltransferase [Sphingomonas sp.]
MSIVIREMEPEDIEAIHALHLACFPTAAEARLVASLDAAGDVLVALVAEQGKAIVGHVCFSRMKVIADGAPIAAAALAPVAVAASLRDVGIGSGLIEQGLAALEDAEVRLAFVLGDTGYYGRFGFEAALAKPFASAYAGPNFQALWLGKPARVRAGEAHHAPAFAALGKGA